VSTDAASVARSNGARLAAALNGRAVVVWLAVLTFALLALLIGLLVSPQRSFVALYVNDLMVFYDGAHRILSGQIPNRDFHTPLGLLAYLLPAFGLWLGGSLGAMAPLATALFAVMLAGPLFYVSATRLPVPFAALFVPYVAILVIAPINPGGSWLEPTFAMFYNRFCWAALSVLFTLALPRIRPVAGGAALDAACAAWLAVILFYLKLSYAAVGAAFLVGLLVLPSCRRFAALALVGAGLALALVEAFWRGTGAYLADAVNAAHVTGAVRGGLYQLAILIVHNLPQGGAYAAALVVGVVRRTRPLYLLGSVAMAICGLLLLDQNAQDSEIPVLLPATLVAVLGPAAPRAGAPAAQPVGLTAFLLFAILALPNLANGALGLRYFRHELKRPPDERDMVAQLDGVVTHEGVFLPGDAGWPHLGAPASIAQAMRSGFVDTSVFNLARQIRSRQPLAQSEYIVTLEDGAAALRADPRLAGPVYTFDLQNPFNAMLGRRPPRGDNSWNHFQRTFNQHVFLKPEQALGDVQIIMDPKDPMDLYSEVFLMNDYKEYIAKNFRPVRETTYWRIYQRDPGKNSP
jgi:hypothetical protein